ncbi:MAG: isocitrate lyase/phosphoenolpyruvate mutase family protein [Burkholderiales bacterium]|nr:isocitrate lyase/phosphoenolpyruvate mutase family protein [Burkholderiales bacterium]
MTSQIERARQFRAMNEQGQCLLPNAWDVASARIYVREGFSAVATTSGGIAYSRGLGDAEQIGRDAMLGVIAQIAASVDVPLSADIEAGYGQAPADVAETVRGVIAAGAVGINLEDRRYHNPGDALFSVAEQAARIGAARAAAQQADMPIWINARTDTFLLGQGEDGAARLALTIERANAYFAAGADMVFVPTLSDVGVIRELVGAVTGPISLMAMPGAPAASEWFAAGAKRVSLGVCPMLAVMGLIRDIAIEAREQGQWGTMARSFYGFGEAEALFA